MTIGAVVFDLGSVLVEVDHPRALRTLQFRLRRCGVELDAAAMLSHIARFECGEVDERTFHGLVCGAAGESIDFTDFSNVYCDMFSPIEPMIAALGEIRRQGLPTVLFSNTSPLHYRHIAENYRFMSGFAHSVLSFNVGCMKPDPRTYQAVELATGLEGPALCYIDDRKENVDGAAKRGWRAIHHTHPSLTLERLTAFGLLPPRKTA